MTDLLLTAYPWIKAIHIMAVISWMAGMFYLPRLFVYHVEHDSPATFEIMEEKLLRVIINPAMGVTWIMGVTLAVTPGIVDWGQLWPWAKLLGILAMSGFHGWCSAERKRLLAGEWRSGRTYRLLNEVPTVLMIIIVIAIVVKPL